MYKIECSVKKMSSHLVLLQMHGTVAKVTQKCQMIWFQSLPLIGCLFLGK